MALLLAIACSDAHPGELVGLWSSRQERGEVLRVLDTLELRSNGTQRQRRLIYTLTPSRRSIFEFDSTLSANVAGEGTWSVIRNDDGRHLCLAETGRPGKLCQPLKVAPETELTFGDTRFTHAGAAR